MNIRFWGTRGSIPAPGPYTIRYGGNTTSVEVLLKDDTLIVIDAGTGIRLLGNYLIKKYGTKIPPIHLFLTHSHWDHIQGFPFFIPAYIPGTKITIYGCPPATVKLQSILENQMESRYFPVDFNDLRAEIDFKNYCEEEMKLGTADIIAIKNYHPGSSNAIKFTEGDKKFVFQTDNELTLPEDFPFSIKDYIEFSKEADLFVHDAQYTDDELAKKKGWGHSSYQQVINLAVEANVKQVGLFHHDPDARDDIIDERVNDARTILRKKKPEIFCFAAREGQKITI